MTPTPLLRGSAGTICLLMAGTCLAGNAFTTAYVSKDDTSDRAAFNSLLQNRSADNGAMFSFSEEQRGIGDAAVTPFGDQVEYKLNAMNYNLHLGAQLYIPFQVYLADIDSSESPADVNEAKLLDPTQGVAVQFPLAYVYRPSNPKRLCGFAELQGYCMVGGDVTVRGVQLSQQNPAGEIDKSFVFGASAALRAAALFPIFEADGVPGGDQAGHLSLAIAARYYYHNTDQQQLLFGEMTAPDGTPIEFKKEFAAFSIESEFDIYEHFKVRLEYFQPLSNQDALDDVFKASFVLSTK